MQADEEQASREGHSSPNIVQRLGVIHLDPERGRAVKRPHPPPFTGLCPSPLPILQQLGLKPQETQDLPQQESWKLLKGLHPLLLTIQICFVSYPSFLKSFWGERDHDTFPGGGSGICAAFTT